MNVSHLVLLGGLAVLLLCCIVITRSEGYALPYRSLRDMQSARNASNVRCTDACIVRLRDRDVINGQCKNMCIDYYPQAYLEDADCGWGWGGYPTSASCDYPMQPTYNDELDASLADGNVGQYKFGMIQ